MKSWSFRLLALLAVAVAALPALTRCHPAEPAAPAPLAAPAPQTTPPAPAPDPARRPADAPVELFLTGADEGYVDACGCDDGLLGGLPRRHTLLRYLGLDDGHALVLSGGGLAKGHSTLDELKFGIQLQAMISMHYGAIALTEWELAFGREVLANVAAAILGDDCPFVATNLNDGADDPGAGVPALIRRRSVVRRLGSRKVAVLAVISESRAGAIAALDPRWTLEPAAAALTRELAEITKREGAPWRTVVLADVSLEEARTLAHVVDGLSLIAVPGEEGDDFPLDRPIAAGSTDIVTTGRKGKFVVRYEFGSGRDGGELHREPVTDELFKSEDVLPLMEQYRDALKETGIIREYYARRPDPGGVAYAGADEELCAQCHEKAWKIWKASRHAHAWQALVDQDREPKPGERKPPLKNAIWDPDCVRCHVTGFGSKSGFRGTEAEKAEAPLINVTCEACHGPAGDHAERALRGDPKYPGPAIGRIADGSAFDLCTKCHDPDNSPQFNMKEYYVGIVRGEQREPVAHGKE
jgi:hypothetical protein